MTTPYRTLASAVKSAIDAATRALGFSNVAEIASKSASKSQIAANVSAETATIYGNAAVVSRTAIDNRIYPGLFAADPITRPDGSAIHDGDVCSLTSGVMRVRIAGAWQDWTTASAAAAAASQGAAAASATAAAASRTAIDNRIYPGLFAAAPTARPDGSAPQDGDRYTNTAGITFQRLGGSWVDYNQSAATSAATATTQANAAAASAATASASQGAAATSATQANNSAALAATGAKFFATIAAGNAGVADGATFGVQAGGTDGLARASVYRRDAAGAQTLLFAVIPGAEFDAKVASVTPASPAKVPLVFDAQGNVAVWLDSGALAAKGLSAPLLASIQTAISPTMTVAGLTNLTLRSSGKIPLAWDDAGNVALWLDGGQLACAGIAPAMVSAVSAGLGSVYTPLKASRSAGAGMVVSDGRFLRQYRAKRALGGVVRVLLDGDSWIQNPPIPQALLTRLSARFGTSGAGWLSAVPSGATLTGVVWNTYTGWTTLDYAQQIAQAAPVRGCGLDGFAAEATGVAAAASVTVRAETFRIFYWDGTGTFRYRVDGGAWTAVAGGNTGAKANVLIAGLTDANHTIDLDTTTNTGTVTLHGFHATRSAAGVELSKCGNGDESGRDASIFANQIAYFANILAPDVVFILLGTNEVRFSRDVPSYTQGLTDKVAAYRSVNPGVGIVIGFPAQCGSVGTLPETAYRDAGLAFAQANNCEWFSGLDLFDTFAVENARGQWNDTNHLNTVGAMNYATSLDNLLLGV